jgi:hypothetical protein
MEQIRVKVKAPRVENLPATKLIEDIVKPR